MKPLAVCLSHKDNTRTEIHKIYPKNINQNDLNEISIKSMPMGAKEGDFLTTSLSHGKSLSSYVFNVLQLNEEVSTIALIAVFPNSNYNPKAIHHNFTKIIGYLRLVNKLSLIQITNLLPKIFAGFAKVKGTLVVDQGNQVTYNYSSLVAGNKGATKDNADDFAKDIWG